MENENEVTTCSFCGRDKDKVKKLMTSGDVAICDKCVGLCNEILFREKVIDIVKESLKG